MIGFVLFWIGIGMLIMLFLTSRLLGLVLAAVFLLLGYNLFCSW